MSLRNLAVGVDDWQRAELVEHYYPEGLPEEWRFDYYLNEFRCVLVAQDEWLNWTEQDRLELQQSRREEAAFCLRVDQVSALDLALLQKVKQVLGDQLYSLVVFDPTWSPQHKDWHGFAVTWVSQQPLVGAWQWRYQDVVISGCPCAWVAQLPTDMKQQRQMLESFYQTLPPQHHAVPFMVASPQVRMEQLAQLQTLAELLGY